jgi:hypothetical protein
MKQPATSRTTDSDTGGWLRRLVRLRRGHGYVCLIQQRVWRQMIAHKKCGQVDDVSIINNVWIGIKLLNKSGQMLSIRSEVKLERVGDGVKVIGQKKSTLLQYIQQPFIVVREFFHGRKNLKQPNEKS